MTIAAAGALAGKEGVRLTGFDVEETTVWIRGEADEKAAATKFSAALLKSKRFGGYELSWGQEPKANSEKDGVFEFSIYGKTREKKSKAKKTD